MSKKYEDLIKNARINADCGEHMSPAEVTTLLNVVEARCAALAAEVYDLKHPGTYLPSKRETPDLDAFLAEVRAQGVEMAAKSDQFSTWVQQGLRSFAIGVRQGDECGELLKPEADQ